jgi:hypothetical protein
MSIELEAQVRIAVPLADVLAHAEATIAKLSRPPAMAPLALDSPLAYGLVVGPFSLAKRDARGDFPVDEWTLWEPGTVDISSGEISVGLTLMYAPSDEERGLPPLPTEQERLENAEFTGYRATIAIYRTRPSFCLAALLASSIAALNRSRIIDDQGRLGRGALVDPVTVEELLAKHGGAETFAQLADRFCGEVGFNSWR